MGKVNNTKFTIDDAQNGQFLCYAHFSDIFLPDDYTEIDCHDRHDRLYLQYARGDGMAMAGIHNGDILVLDKKTAPMNGDIVALSVGDDTHLCRRYFQKDCKTWFRREDGVTPDIAPEDFTIHAVVIGVIKRGRFCSHDFNPDIKATHGYNLSREK